MPEVTAPAPGVGDANTERRAALGIQVTETDDVIPGLTVAGFSAGSGPTDTGLKVGDLIFAMDGVPTPTIPDVARMLRDRQPGDEVTLRLVRDRQSMTVTMNLKGKSVATTKPNVNREPFPARSSSGSIAAEELPMTEELPTNLASPAQVEELSSPISPVAKSTLPAKSRATSPDAIGITIRDAKGVRGPMVEAVADNSPAAAAGLRAGDRIVSLDGRLMVDTAALNRELKLRVSTETLPLQLVRDGKLIAADVQLTGDRGLASVGSSKSEESKVAGDDKSVLGGFGSMLGGLLGGKADADAKPKVKSLRDEMALEGRGVEQASFESDLKAATKSDPPSLDALELPPEEELPIQLNPKTDSGKSLEDDPAALRAEIQRLRERLKAAESKE